MDSIDDSEAGAEPPREGKSGSTNDWDADDYEGEHSFVYEYGADLLDLFEPTPDERVLDVGCGTGQLTAELHERAGDALGVDAAPEMVERARQRHGGPTVRVADAREMSFEAAFDAALSNAALHWIPAADQDAVLRSVHEALVPGGRFVAEMGGAGNVGAIVGALRAELAERGHQVEHPWYFPSVGEYATRLEAAGFEVRFARLFDRPTDLEGGEEGLATWIGMFADDLLAPVEESERDAVVTGVDDRLRDAMFDDETVTWTADYRRLRFVAVRENS